MYARFVLLAAIACALMREGRAQTAVARPLTLAEAMEEARAVALDVQLARLRLTETEGLRKAERADLLPELRATAQQSRQERSIGAYGLPEEAEVIVPEPFKADIEYNIPRSLVRQFNLPTEVQLTVPDPTPVAVSYSDTTGAYDWMDARLRLSVPLIDVSAWREYRASTAELARARADVAAAEEQAMLTAGELYFRLLYAAEQARALKERALLQEKRVALFRDQVASGLATELELRREALALSRLNAELRAARTEETQKKRELLRLLNRLDDETLMPADAMKPIRQIEPAIPAAIDHAFDLRADLRSRRHREIAARLQRDAARAASQPTLKGFGTYGLQGNEYRDTVEAWSVGALLDVPLWDFFKREGRLDQRASQFEQARTRTLDLEQAIRVDVPNRIESLALARDTVHVARETVALAREQLALRMDQESAGVASPLDVNTAEVELAEALRAEGEALYVCNIAALRLCAALGDVRSILWMIETDNPAEPGGEFKVSTTRPEPSRTE